ncbi:MAG: AMP-binding protein [Actinocatenispora sp.]
MSGPPAGDGNRIAFGSQVTSWGQLALAGGPTPPDPAAVLADDVETALRAVRHHVRYDTELLVAALSRVDDQLRDQLLADGFGLSGAETTEPTREPEPGRLWILTSGTTGRPKRIAHTLTSLTTVRDTQPPRVWLCPYSPGTYAWWQLITLSLHQPGQDLVITDPRRLDDWPLDAGEHGVTAVSGTPTFWRQSLYRHGELLSRLPLQQITLGGEPVDQSILDVLSETFPAARISWIYASSEVGAAIVVHDGRAGFPRSWLDRAVNGKVQLSVVDNELLVRSPHRGAGMDEWVHTGDRAEQNDDRVLITGRLAGDEINVGGSKVSAGAIRDLLLTHPAVRWARVSGRRAPLVGQVVAAEIVTDGSLDGTALQLWAADRLAEHAVPRRIRVLPDIPVKESLKSDV